MDESEVPLSRTAASHAVESIGWRYLLGTLCTSVAVESLDEALRVATEAVRACDADADGHLRADLRTDRVELSLQTRILGVVTSRDVGLAQRISASVPGLGTATAGATSVELPRPVQMLELAIDALNIPAIRPFWKAVLAYTDDPGDTGPAAAIVDPTGNSRRSGSSRWMPLGHSGTVCTSTSPSLTTRPSGGSGQRSQPAGCWWTTATPDRSGCWPMSRATRCASVPGPTGMSGTRVESASPPALLKR